MNEPSAPSGGHTPSSPSAATPHPTGLSHWFAELKRRRVFRALVAYGIAAFAVLQIIEPIMHGLRWPETVLSYVVAALAAGFPVVIALAWVFDVKSGRLERTPSPAAIKGIRGFQLAMVFLGLGLFAAAGLLLAVAVGRTLRTRTSAPRVQSIAVLPLENLSQDSEQEYFADGMTDALITNLGKISALRVISRTSVMRYKGTKPPLQEIARELQIDAVVEGTVARSGDRVRITVHLVQAAPEKHLWAESYERHLRDILVLQGDLSRAIAGEIQIRLSPQEQSALAMARPIDPQAHDAYLKGRFYFEQRNMEAVKKGLEYFKQAVQLDPGYALAYVGIAASYGVLGYYGGLPPNEAIIGEREAALKALELNPLVAETHVQLGYVRERERNRTAAENEFKRAIELSPNSSDAYHAYSMLLTTLRRYDEALEENQRKRQLDPLWPGSASTGAWICYYARRYEQGLDLARESLQIDQNFAPSHWILGLIYEQQGRYEDAIEELSSALKLASDSPFVLGMLGHAYAVAGRTKDAERVLEQLQQSPHTGYTSAYDLAAVYIGLRRNDQALASLNKAVADGDSSVIRLSGDPRFDNLRSDSRLAELLRRLGLPP
jgi:TolB-like protein/Flp pilus assembly protein TadD